MDNNLSKIKVSEKNKVYKKYLEKLELLKQVYGIEFKIENLNDNHINKIKFYNIDYQKSIKNVSLIYDNGNNDFNFVSYDYDKEKDVINLTDQKLIDDLTKKYKLKILIKEIVKNNIEFINELEKIDCKYNNLDSKSNENGRELEITKKNKKN